jgi:F-type H+-transporting ATPase subunit epsilon
MKTFNLEIVTPERIVYQDEVEYLSAPGKMGTLGILPNHAALFTALSQGELKIKKNGEDIFMSIGGGFLEVTQNQVQVLVTRAVNADKLNEQEIMAAKKQAEEALKNKPSGKDLSQAQALYRQSLVDLSVLRRRKRR